MLEELGEGNTVDDLMQGNKYYTYYKESFSAMLSGLLGVYEKEAPDGMGGKKIVSGYGLIAYRAFLIPITMTSACREAMATEEVTWVMTLWAMWALPSCPLRQAPLRR